VTLAAVAASVTLPCVLTIQPVTGRDALTGFGAWAGGTEDGAPGAAVGDVLGIIDGDGTDGDGTDGDGDGDVVDAHFTQNTFCLARPCSPLKFQNSL
jgi:hypothetical protein